MTEKASIDISSLDTNHYLVVAARRMVELHSQHDTVITACEALLAEFPLTPDQALLLWIGINAKNGEV